MAAVIGVQRIRGWFSRSPGRFARTGFAETTLAEIAWQRVRTSAHRWAGMGAVLGAIGGLVAFVPAGWLASRVEAATAGRLLLTDARGTIWNGSALPVLTGGEGSRDAAALPDRLHWQLGFAGLVPELRLRQACCLRGEVRAQVRPGWGRVSLRLLPEQSTTIGQWPAGVLAGLGTPWNTMQMGGLLRLTSPGMTVETVQGRVRFTGDAALDIAHASSRVSPLDELGSYRVTLSGNAASGDVAQLKLITVDGPLKLSGTGQWGSAGLRFRGEASAEAGSEAALNNLLNIIGKRQGASSIISIG
jgi:general secretion pathway protein N